MTKKYDEYSSKLAKHATKTWPYFEVITLALWACSLALNLASYFGHRTSGTNNWDYVDFVILVSFIIFNQA